jgi:hypothetical protein
VGHSSSSQTLFVDIEDMMLARMPANIAPTVVNQITSEGYVFSDTAANANVNLNTISVEKIVPVPPQNVPAVYTFEFNPNVVYNPNDSLYISLTRYGANTLDTSNRGLHVLGATINMTY